MSNNLRVKVLGAIVTTVLSGCGGSGENTQDVSVSSVPSSAAAAVAGDWVISSGNTRALSARTSLEWQALWSDRRAQINCSLSFNQAACAATTAPSIDFSSYDLIGVALASYCSFGSLAPKRVFLDFSAAKLVVEVSYVCVFKVPLLPESTNTMFFLVPKSPLPVELRVSEA